MVVDECHVYRGVFGSHVAALLRRLRRTSHGRSRPSSWLSATVRDPATHASRLVGLPVRALERDGSPREAMTFGLWEPGELPGSAGCPVPAGVLATDTRAKTPA